MKKYLLDTNICIFYLKGKFGLDKKLEAIGFENCCISEITVAELRFGAENSQRIQQNRANIDKFQEKILVVPILGTLDLYAKEKARLRKLGKPVDDFDLLIGVASVVNGLTMVTNNTIHFERILGIELEDWTVE